MPAPPPRRAALALLVRHGRTPTTGEVLPGRAAGLHLSEAGQAQAGQAAELISDWGRVAAVYASPLERAQETAEPIAKRLGVEVLVEPSLLECDFGEWTGAALKDLRELREWRTVQSWPAGWRFPGGESFMEMQARIVAGIAELASRHAGEAFVAVSHADPLKALLAHALGLHLDLFQRITISPASVSAVSFGEEGPAVLAVNANARISLAGPGEGEEDQGGSGG